MRRRISMNGLLEAAADQVPPLLGFDIYYQRIVVNVRVPQRRAHLACFLSLFFSQAIGQGL